MRFTVAYSLMFLYILATIVFWGYSLNKQNKTIYTLEKDKLALMHQTGSLMEYEKELDKIHKDKMRRTQQYTGEGSTFALIILFTACIVYYAYYRQRRLAKLQENFMLSVTHELKTPIAGIKLNMQTLEKRVLADDIRNKIIRNSIIETDRLNDLCNNILIATQLESAQQAIYSEEVNLTRLCEEVVQQVRDRNPGTSIHCELPDAPVYLQGDTALFKLIFSNLIENARKYSPKEEAVEVVLQPVGKKLAFQVKDRGPGIPEAERERIFEKFYRAGNENTRSTKGTGLGLYIVRKISSLYKFDIVVKNNLPRGTIFEVRLT